MVASEVRKLAERSQKAAGEIGELSGNTVQVAEQAGEKLNKLVPDIQKTAELVQEISVAAKEQDTGAEEINKALQQLDSVVQRSAASAEELSGAASELLGMSEEQRDAMNFFKLSQSAVSASQAAPVAKERRSKDSAGARMRADKTAAGKASSQEESSGEGFVYSMDDADHTEYVKY